MSADPEWATVLDRACRGDGDPAAVEAARRAVDALFAAHADRIYAVCLRFTGRPEVARELAQETLATAYRQLATFRRDGDFGAWLYGIARFKCLRAREKRQELLTDDGVLELSDPEVGVLGRLTRDERLTLLREVVVATLDETEQEAVWLRYAEGVGQDEIGEILGLEDRTGGRGLLQRCRRKLTRALRERLAAMGRGSSFFRESQA